MPARTAPAATAERRWPAGVELAGRDGAPVVVLGASLGTTRRMWQQQLGALGERFRVLSYDHLGHGEAPPAPARCTVETLGRHLLAVLDALGIRRASYAGLSLGGMVGMWLAATVPHRVDRLALLCTSAHLPPAQDWRDRAAAVRAGGTAAVADAVLARWFTPGFAARHPDRVADYRAMLTGVPAAGYAACCEVIAALDLRPDLARIRAGTLVVAGAGDPATPVPHARLIAAGIGRSRLHVLPDAAHLANVEQPAEVTRLLIEHLGGAP
ncbi:3-oxoadipate enol-lactonase [Plantactinospora sp. KBS50]|nr:3-oxoadipate enol-lactonase [Plantactinospora sp. KBS50]